MTVSNSPNRLQDDFRAYTAYGHARVDSGERVCGFNGQPLDRQIKGYHLGQGKRFYSPTRMAFCSPDTLSPFGIGGINCYAYCGGDPVNFSDPSGSSRVWGKMPPPAYSPKRRASEHFRMRPAQKTRERRHSLPKNWKDSGELPTFSDASRYIDENQLNAVRYDPDTQRNKIKPTYDQATDPRGLAAQKFANDYSGSAYRGNARTSDYLQLRPLPTLRHRAIVVVAAIVGLGMLAGPIIISSIRKDG